MTKKTKSSRAKQSNPLKDTIKTMLSRNLKRYTIKDGKWIQEK